MSRVYIDADGCPVIRNAVRICSEYGIPVTLVCDTSHSFRDIGAEVITVGKGADSADLKLVNLINAGDIVIKQDYGLAAMCLARSGICISQDGLVYDSSNIDSLLLSRHIAKKVRRSGGRLKGPRKRTQQEDKRFETAFEVILKSLTNNKERR